MGLDGTADEQTARGSMHLEAECRWIEPTFATQAVDRRPLRAGVFDDGWNHARYKAVRDYLSQKGWIKWEDCTHRQGIACKWQVDPKLVAEVMSILKPEASAVSAEEEDSPFPLVLDLHFSSSEQGPNAHQVPKRVWMVDPYPSWYHGGPLSAYFSLAA